MKKVSVRQDHNNYPTIEIRAERALNTRPVILKEYSRAGVRYYAGVDGKSYVADAFDQFFNPGAKLKILPDKRKGENIDRTRAGLKK